MSEKRWFVHDQEGSHLISSKSSEVLAFSYSGLFDSALVHFHMWCVAGVQLHYFACE